MPSRRAKNLWVDKRFHRKLAERLSYVKTIPKFKNYTMLDYTQELAFYFDDTPVIERMKKRKKNEKNVWEDLF